MAKQLLDAQIKLLKKYGVNNYTIENGEVTINGSINRVTKQLAVAVWWGNG